jgi:predicted secreted hydrolase
MRATLLLGCALWCAAALSAGPPAVLPPAADSSFEQALTVRPFAFPRDYGPHPGFRQEWWYFSGNLDAADGERFGFELTFFRYALAPADTAPPPPEASRWRSRELYLAHFAITDAAQRRFRFASKLSRAALALAGAQPSPLKVWIDDWSLAEAGAETPAWRLKAAEPGYALALELTALGPPVANGEQGLSRKSDEPSAASYYFSVPRLAAHGHLLRDGKALAVSGLAWLDREWGSGGLGRGQAGWDWFAVQLADGSTLMFYALRGRDGRRDSHSAGTFVSAAGEVRALRSEDVAIAVTGTWRSATGAQYPARWRLQVPSLGLAVQLAPLLPDQELNTTPRYWEGAVDVRGSRGGTALGGRGYVELTGYEPARSH